MFTEESIYLHKKFLPEIKIQNTNELKLLYKHLNGIKIDSLIKTYYNQKIKESNHIFSSRFADKEIVSKSNQLNN